MKLSLISILLIVGVIGCSSPQAPPPPTGTTIPGLNIPDTIDFGMVRAGIAKDTNIVFRNSGTDTIKISSQRFSDSAFKLSNVSQSQLSIAPGASQTVTVQFLPTDISSALGYDTIRTANKTNIIVLRGSAIPFSSLFPTPPNNVTVTVTGLLGKDMDGSTHPFAFYFSAPINLTQSGGGTFYFNASSNRSNLDPRSGDVTESWSLSTSVLLHIDTISLLIDTAIATYDSTYYERDRGYWYTDEGLNLHGIRLTKVSNQYSAEVTGASLSAIIASAYFQSEVWNNTVSTLKSIVGYQNSAKLTILIQ